MAVTAEEAALVLAGVDRALKLPRVGPEHIVRIVEIALSSGALHVEVYATVPWATVIGGPADAGVSVFTLARSAKGEWRLETGSSARLSPDRPVETLVADLEAQQEWFRPKPVAPREPRSQEKHAPMSEREGAGSLAETPIIGDAPRVTDGNVDDAERALGTRLPAGYRTFVVALGAGVFGNKLRVYPPAQVVGDLAKWRERIERHWFWGEEPLAQATALECVCVADTLDGDEIVFHPSDPDALYLLPRHSERARALGRGIAKAIAKLVRAKRPALEAFQHRGST